MIRDSSLMTRVFSDWILRHTDLFVDSLSGASEIRLGAHANNKERSDLSEVRQSTCSLGFESQHCTRDVEFARPEFGPREE